MTEVSGEPSIAIKLHKDFGYSSFGNDVQGKFTAQTTVSEDVTRVEFYLDNLLQLNDTDTPFSWSYNTDDYTLGLHTIKVVAYDTDGTEASAEKNLNFVEPVNFTIIIILTIGIVIIAAIIVLFVKMKKK